MSMRRFHLNRIEDESGVSGTGKVAEGVLFNGTFYIVSWISLHRSLTTYLSLAELQAVHGHEGKTELVWIDGDPELPSEKQSGIPEPKPVTGVTFISIEELPALKVSPNITKVSNNTSKISSNITKVSDQSVGSKGTLTLEEKIAVLVPKINTLIDLAALDPVEDEVIGRLKALGDNDSEESLVATDWYNEMPDK